MTHQVLMVDHDSSWLRRFVERHSAMSARLPSPCSVLTAQNAAEALRMVRTNTVDLVVSRLGLPVLDGIQLVRLLRMRQPLISALVMAHRLTDEDRRMCRQAGAKLVLERPLSDEGIDRLCHTIDRYHRRSENALPSTSVTGMNLPDLFLSLRRQACDTRLTVHALSGVGEVEVRKGWIQSARFQDAEGQEALRRILDLPRGRFVMRPSSDRPTLAPPPTTPKSSGQGTGLPKHPADVGSHAAQSASLQACDSWHGPMPPASPDDGVPSALSGLILETI